MGKRMWRHALVIVLASGLAAVASGQKEPQQVDRSGEKILDQLAAHYEKFGSVRFSINTAAQDRPNGPFYADSQTDVAWDGKSKYRVEQMDMWGDGGLWVSDGSTLLQDSLELEGTVTLLDALKTDPLADAKFSPGNPQGSMLFSFFHGRKAIDALLKKESKISLGQPNYGYDSIIVESIRLGEVTIYYAPKTKQIYRFEYKSRPSFEQQMDGLRPIGAALSRQDITYYQVGGRLPAILFSTTPPEGMDVVDRRAKKSSAKQESSP